MLLLSLLLVYIRPVFLVGPGPSLIKATIRVPLIGGKVDPQVRVGSEGAGRNSVSSPAVC